MAMVVANNMPAMLVLNETNKNNKGMKKALSKVSSGMKINSAEDGASEYAISKRMEVMIRSLGQDNQNTETGRNLVNTAEGGIQEIINTLRDMKRMAINSANDHNTDLDRQTLEKEFQQRMQNISDIAATTNYNGKYLLNGTYQEPYYMHVCESTPIYSNGALTGVPAGTVIKVVTAPGVGGYSLIQENSIDDLTARFTPKDSDTVDRGRVNSYDGTPCEGFAGSRGTNQSDTVAVKMDFSGLTVNGGSASIPADLDGQGFTVLCAGCEQFINISFDASLPASASTYSQGGLGGMNGNADIEYVIGVAGLTDIADLGEKIFDGLKAMGSRPDSYYDWGQHGTVTEDASTALLDKRHFVRIEKGDDGNYYLCKEKNAPTLCVYDEGTYLTHVTNGAAIEGNPVVEGYYTTQGADPTITQVVGYDLVEKEIDKKGIPLIIHTGTKANQHLRVFINGMSPQDLGIQNVKIVPREAAVQAMTYLDEALAYSLNENTRMGAYQSRLEMTSDNLTVAEENTTASLSVIRDADMAKEMTEYTKYSLLTQSSQAMLAQANQNGSQVLSLLQ